MDRHHLAPSGLPYAAYAMEEAAFRTQPYGKREHDLVVDPVMDYSIDPALQSEPSPTLFQDHWDPPQPFQRYMEEGQKSTFFHPDLLLQADSGSAMVQGLIGTVPAHLPTHGRLGSPITSDKPSSASNGPSSPRADTDSYYDGYQASTPSDGQGFSPIPYDKWAALDNFAHLGQSHMENANFVNLTEVNPSQQDLVEEPSAFDLDIHRGFSFESYSSQLDADLASDLVAPETIKRCASPEGIRHIASGEAQPVSHYLPVSLDQREGVAASGAEQGAPSRKRPRIKTESEEEEEQENESKQGDSDGDYKPVARTKAAVVRLPPRRAVKSSSAKKLAVATQSSPSSSQPRKKTRMPSAGSIAPVRGPIMTPGPTISAQLIKKGPFSCADCAGSQFKDRSSLESHIKKQHTRPFTCVFHFAGCTSTFASKNEWKRHVSSQHLLLHYWLCTEGICAKNVNTPRPTGSRARGTHQHPHSSASLEAGALPDGTIFNRKDLYTQHVRRMHMPPLLRKALEEGEGGLQQQQQQQQQKQKKGNTKSRSMSSSSATAANVSAASSEWEDRVRQMQGDAIQNRCALPTYMRCPAEGCSFEFHGGEAWDQRMEHVAKHLDKAAAGEEPAVAFGGETDETLLQWCLRPDVAVVKEVPGAAGYGGARAWELNNPLRPIKGAGAGKGKGGAARRPETFEEEDNEDEEEEEEEEDDEEEEEEPEEDQIIVGEEDAPADDIFDDSL